jgi:hypothetical protein
MMALDQSHILIARVCGCWPVTASASSYVAPPSASGASFLAARTDHMRTILSLRTDLTFGAEQVDALARAFSDALDRLGAPAVPCLSRFQALTTNRRASAAFTQR